VDSQADRHDEANSRFFCNFANMPTKPLAARYNDLGDDSIGFPCDLKQTMTKCILYIFYYVTNKCKLHSEL
jgi:hypothetical protein